MGNTEKRITVSFFYTAFRAVVNFCTALLLARLLGPDDFGRFSFLVATFIALKQFLDMASSEAFFKFVSERARSKKFVQIYSAWIVIQLSIVVIFIGILFPESLLEKFWAGEQKLVILLALMAMFLRETVWSNVANLSESYRLTTYNQGLQTIVVLCHLFILASLWLLGSLVIEFVFLATVLEWTLASIWLFRIINQHQVPDASILKSESTFPIDTVKSVFFEFWTYCKFLIPYAWVGFIVDFSSRWMLQAWGSSKEQAYFSIGQQFAAISILAASSLLKVFWKEVAEAHYHNDLQRMEMLYTKSSYFLYFTASIGAGTLLPWTNEIIDTLLGNKYADAAVTMQLMFIYPVHQTLGILTGTLLYATGYIRLQVTLGLFFSAVSLAFGFYLMAPDTVWRYGLNLGAEGLAIRFVLVNAVFVNVWAFMISRLFGWRFKWFYQVMLLSLTLTCGYAAKALITVFFPLHTIMTMSISAVLYLSIIALLVYRWPIITGFTREEMREFFNKIISKRSELNSSIDHNSRGA
jgi:O-antigen/teichoic acid export membrane protein